MPSALAKARKRDALGRVLKSRVPESIYLELAKAVAEPEASPEALLGFALKSRKAVVGTTGVEMGLQARHRAPGAGGPQHRAGHAGPHPEPVRGAETRPARLA